MSTSQVHAMRMAHAQAVCAASITVTVCKHAAATDELVRQVCALYKLQALSHNEASYCLRILGIGLEECDEVLKITS